MIRTLLSFLMCMQLALAGCASAEPPNWDVTKLGVVGDGTTSNSGTIQKAIDDCSAKGGGIVRFPPGKYLTGTVQLKDNVTLHLDDQAVILGSTNAAEYRNLDPFLTGDGDKLGEALIVAVDAHHVGIDGPGTIDGQGKALSLAEKKYTMRPFLIRWIRCTDVTERDIQLRQPGAWTNVFFQCENVSVDHVNIRSRGLRNTDGIDVDSCKSVKIQNCDIESGDDAVCIKATSAKGCRDVNISGCTLSTLTNAVKLGTESLGDFEHIDIADCRITQAGYAGIALFSVDGANLHDVKISNLTMDHVTGGMIFRLGDRGRTFRDGDVKKPVGALHDIEIENVHATNIKQIGMLVTGIPGHCIENLKLENIDLETNGGGKAEDSKVQLAEKPAAYPEIVMFGHTMPVFGLYARHVRGVTFDHVNLHTAKPDPREPAVLIDGDGVQMPDFGKTGN